jgi:hypothetical protein
MTQLKERSHGVKKTLSAILVLATALGLSACSEEDLAFGAGVVVGVIIGDSHDHNHGPREPRPPRYRRGRRYHRLRNTEAVLTASQFVALKYSLEDQQAERLTAHLEPALKGDLSGLRALGFENSDLLAIMKGENPSASTLLTLADKLGVDLSEANRIIQLIKVDAETAKSQLLSNSTMGVLDLSE